MGKKQTGDHKSHSKKKRAMKEDEESDDEENVSEPMKHFKSIDEAIDEFYQSVCMICPQREYCGQWDVIHCMESFDSIDEAIEEVRNMDEK